MAARQRRNDLRLGGERLDHHLGLATILNDKGAIVEDAVHGVDNLVEATGCPLLLRKTRNAQVVALAMLNNGHDLDRKADLLDVEEVLLAHTRKQDVALLVNLDVSNSPFAPLPQ